MQICIYMKAFGFDVVPNEMNKCVQLNLLPFGLVPIVES